MALPPFSRFYSTRVGHFSGACVVIFLGLMLRKFGYSVGLPFIVVKYGGSILWGSMVYLLIAAVLAHRAVRVAVITAIVVAVIVEFIRLVHFPTLDSFRATTAGALLLGRFFSVWNIVCYVTGIGAAAFIAAQLSARLNRFYAFSKP